MTKRSSFHTYFLRAAVLELLVDDLEPHVEHFECVEHPKRLNRPDRQAIGIYLAFDKHKLWLTLLT